VRDDVPAYQADFFRTLLNGDKLEVQ